jgi:hypothetical protein
MAQPGKEDAIDLLKGWFERDLGRYAKWDLDVEIVSIESDGRIRIRFYTEIHRFSISARPPTQDKPNGYLGCIADSRKPRPGEDWTRGNDLRDGPLTEATWIGIMGDIIAFGILQISKASRIAVGPPGTGSVVRVDEDGKPFPAIEKSSA